MSRNIYRRRHRTGLVSADIFRPGVDDLAELGALAPSDVWDGSLIHVRGSNTIYAYDLESTDSADGLNIISPATGVGRWLKIDFGGAGTGSSADKWVDTTKIVSTETVTVDKTASSDWPQEVIRELIDVEGTLSVDDGYVIVGPENLSETLGLHNHTQGNNVVFTAGDNLLLPRNAPPTLSATQGSFFVGDGTGGTTAGEPYYKEGAAGTLIQIATSQDIERINLPEAPNATTAYYGWAARACTLVSVKVVCTAVNSSGTLKLKVSKVSGGTATSVLSGADFDMNAISANTVSNVALTSTAATLLFPADTVWKVELVSDNAGMNGAGFYVALVFEVK